MKTWIIWSCLYSFLPIFHLFIKLTPYVDNPFWRIFTRFFPKIREFHCFWTVSLCLFPYLPDVHRFRTVLVRLVDHSRSSVGVSGHSCRGSVFLLDWFYFRGNKKVMRMMKTTVQNEVWPCLTDIPRVHPWVQRSNTVIPMGKTVKHGHTRGCNGHTRSYPGV